MRSGCIAAIVVAAVLGTIVAPPRLLLVWNTTASTPIGLYVVTQATPKRGDLLVTRLPPEMESLAVSRAMLSPNTPVLKPIAALAGDLVCRFGSAVTINGRFAAIARRARPAWPQSANLARMPPAVSISSLHPCPPSRQLRQPLLRASGHALARGVAHPLVTFRRLTSADARPSPGRPLLGVASQSAEQDKNTGGVPRAFRLRRSAWFSASRVSAKSHGSDYEQDKELTLDAAVGSLQQQVHDIQSPISF